MKKWISVLISLLISVPNTLVALAAETATLEAVRVSPDAVQIHTDAPVRYNAFTTSVPPKLIVELINARLKASQTVPGAGKILRRVRSGQYQSQPVSIARIVLDLAEKTAYDVAAKGNDINVKLLPAGTSAKGQEPAENLKDAPSLSLQETTVTPLLSTAAAAAEPSESLIPEEDKPKKKLPVIPAKKADTVPARTGDIMNTLPKEPISIDYDSADIRDVLNMLAAKMGVNIIYSNDVAGSITIRLTKVPFDEAFKTILNTKGLSTEQVGNNILRIATPQIIIAERTSALPVTKIFTLNYSKASDIKTQIDSIMAAEARKGVCTVDTNNNMIIMTDTPSGLESVARLIKQLDQKPRQVLIEAKLVEVALNNDLNLGINWSGYGMDQGKIAGKDGTTFYGSGNTSALVGPPSIGGPSGLFSPYSAAPTAIPSPVAPTAGGTGVSLPASVIYGAFRLGRITNNYFFDATLSASASKGKVKVLSDPKVATLNNKQATINITTQIPYTTTETTQTVPPISTTKVTYLTVGIILDVTPTINADGRVSLKVKPSVSQPSATVAPVAGGAIGVDTRSADTTVMIRDGETIVIGGLITDRLEEGLFKVPLFGDIPLLGWLFKKKTSTRKRAELLIFVTPRIMED